MYKPTNQTYGQQQTILNVYRLPARLTVDQVAALLGCQPHDVPILVNSKLLTPLGKPPPNGIKFFPTALLEELQKDLKWLDAATRAVNSYWRGQNLRKKSLAARAAQQPPLDASGVTGQ
jgi:hypothetical protein